ncbi:MAG: hypothetical protein ACFCU4_07950 [Puniceicoccaceae bacterium]
MNPALVHTAHLVGVMLIFSGLGILYAAATKGETSGGHWKTGNILAGTGLLLTFLFGFARMHLLNWPLWGFAKLGLWLFLGAAPILMKKSPQMARLSLYLSLAAGFLAICLVYWRPF